MFHDLKPDMLARLEWLEARDATDRLDGTPKNQRLRQIPRDTGRFLAILAAAAPDGDVIEIGTSGGYSTLWLALAAAQSDRKVTTFEIDADKITIATETFREAGLSDAVQLVHGDALQLVENHSRIAFCFLDAEKDDYAALYEIVVPKLVPGGLLVADNVISHAETLGEVVRWAEEDDRVDSVVVPIGRGELVCRKVE